MLTAMMAVWNMQGARHDIWSVNTDFEYHEEQRLEREIEPGIRVEHVVVGRRHHPRTMVGQLRQVAEMIQPLAQRVGFVDRRLPARAIHLVDRKEIDRGPPCEIAQRRGWTTLDVNDYQSAALPLPARLLRDLYRRAVRTVQPHGEPDQHASKRRVLRAGPRTKKVIRRPRQRWPAAMPVFSTRFLSNGELVSENAGTHLITPAGTAHLR